MQNLFVCFLTVRNIAVIVSVISFCASANAQVTWDGDAGDGLWNTPANWVGNAIPSNTDDVLLDHSVVNVNYIVTLPAGVSSVAVRTLSIFPAVGRIIEVLLPVSNTAIPAFTAIGSVYGLIIHPGGIFRNSSGASAGTPVNISDSIKINNGGLYVHNTGRAHASNVTVLSIMAGTERGTFEFDVPGSAGYTVSIAGRTYGNMVLSATAAGGPKSYTSTGITAVNINGEFRINHGVNYSLNFNGAFIIHGSFFHHGNIFDISSGPQSNRINLRENMFQSGIITKSGTGLPVLEFNGNMNQDVSLVGSITGSNTFRINNAAGITLQSPVSISYKLELIKGNIRTTSANILVMHDNSICVGGSSSSFIEGPLRKIGDDDFDFPVGKQADYAPVSIAGAGGTVTDEFEAEYFHGNPTIIFGSAIEAPPIIRVSGLEYWNLRRNAGIASKKITLNVRTYSNATLLEKLIVSRWDMPGIIWRSEGNTAFSGIASGTITSGDVHSFGVFTIASTVANQNPLPQSLISVNIKNQDANILLSWQLDPSINADHFEIQRSEDNIHFTVVKKIEASPNTFKYQFSEKLPVQGIYYYKLKVTEKNGNTRISRLISVSYRKSGIELVTVSGFIFHNMIGLTISSAEKALLNLYIINAEGKIVQRTSTVVHKGSMKLSMDISNMPAGIYYLAGSAGNTTTNIIRLIKL
ncbi:MAG: hypothetical protein H7122_09530 [Chitinophagaceae bacterium]|nr:hypothetical protein [Chitinophagaceae bacterium]